MFVCFLFIFIFPHAGVTFKNTFRQSLKLKPATRHLLHALTYKLQ